MAKIQILEISPMETPMEDLSEDITSNVQGGKLFDTALGLLDEIFDSAGKLLNELDDLADFFLDLRVEAIENFTIN